MNVPTPIKNPITLYENPLGLRWKLTIRPAPRPNKISQFGILRTLRSKKTDRLVTVTTIRSKRSKSFITPLFSRNPTHKSLGCQRNFRSRCELHSARSRRLASYPGQTASPTIFIAMSLRGTTQRRAHATRDLGPSIGQCGANVRSFNRHPKN